MNSLINYSTISKANIKDINVQGGVQIDNYYVYDYTLKDLEEIEVKLIQQNYKPDFITFLQNIKLYLSSQGFKRIVNNVYTTDYFNYELLDIPCTHPDRSATNAFYTKLYKKLQNYVDLNLSLDNTTLKFQNNTLYSPITLSAHTTANMWQALVNGATDKKNYLIGTSIRREREDSSHQIEFYSLELLVQSVNFETLQNILLNLFNHLGLKVSLRRTKYPYVEPALEIVYKYHNKQIELGGAGLFTRQLCKLVNRKQCILGAGIGLSRLWLVLSNRLHLKDLNDLN